MKKIFLCLFLFFMFLSVDAAAIYGPSSCTSTHYRIIKNDEFGTDTFGITSTSYNIPWAVISFYGTENMTANTYYDIKVTFINNLPTNFISNVEFYQTNSLCGSQSGQFQVSSFTQSGKVLTFRVLTGLNTVDFWQTWITLSGVTNNNGLSSITLTKVDMSGSEGIIENNNNNTNNIINNNNQNTQDVINNQNQNTQDVINNQNQNTQDIIDSQKVCKIIDKTSGITDGFLYNNGQVGSDSNQVVTDYFPVSVNTTIIKLNPPLSDAAAYRICFYNPSKVFISCLVRQDYTSLTDIPIPDTASYVRFTIQKTDNVPKFKLCSNGDELVQGSIDNLNETQKDTNDLLSDSTIDSDLGTGFFDDFESNDFGLSDIITLPLTTIQSLTSTSCQPLRLPIPYTNKHVDLPCMSAIYVQKIPNLYNLYSSVVFGIVAYYIATDIFRIVKGFKDPESDKVEVLDL